MNNDNYTSGSQTTNDLNQAKGMAQKASSFLNGVSKQPGKILAKKAKSIDKAKLKEGLEKMLKGIVRLCITLLGSTAGLAILAIVIVVVILCVVPMGSWFSTEGDVDQIRHNTDSVIQKAYQKKQEECQKDFASYIQGLSGVSVSGSDFDDGSFQMENNDKIVDVSISFSPDYKKSVDSINAYANAVNSVIGYFGGNSITAETQAHVSDVSGEEISEFIKMDEAERQKWISSHKSEVDSSGDEIMSQKNDNFAQTLRTREDLIFTPIYSRSDWDSQITVDPNYFTGEYEKKTVYKSYSCKVTGDAEQKVKTITSPTWINSTCVGQEGYEVDDKSKPIIKEKISGSVSVTMKCDVRFYKREELNALPALVFEDINNQELHPDKSYSEREAYSVVNETLFEYYLMYLDYYGITPEDELYESLTSEGFWSNVMLDTIIDGDVSELIDKLNELGIDITLEGLMDKLRQAARARGETGVQCTVFAQVINELVYGTHYDTPNGKNVAYTLAKNYNYKYINNFDDIVPMTTCSRNSPNIKYREYGHVTIVVNTYKENGKRYMTVAESNLAGDGRVTVKTYDYDEYTTKYTGVTFAAPK